MDIQEKVKKSILKYKIFRKIIYLHFHYLTDCYVVSYPKSGRTWLRFMLAKALALHYGDQRDIVYDPMDVIRRGYYRGPLVQFTHNGVDCPLDVEAKLSPKQYQQFKYKRVIFLIRDPRDILVSYYFHRTRRMNEYYNLSDFIRHPWWGIGRILMFMNEWYEYRHIPMQFLLVRYEDLHNDPINELYNILHFINLYNVSDKIIRASVHYSSFENLQKISINEKLPRLVPINSQDQESFKVRKGEIGGYMKHLSVADIEYIDGRIRHELPSSFGYTDR